MKTTDKMFKGIICTEKEGTMKTHKKIICLLLTVILLFALLAGCSETVPEIIEDEKTLLDDISVDTTFSYSEGINDDGFWADIKALDYIEIFDYKGIIIPSDVHQVSEEDIQTEIDYILWEYASTEDVTDRTVVDGDTVNIDYVGSVDGVEFAGGSTGGAGTYVTAGSMDYIDDFLIQIIGHMPGETINVEVTFPESYHESSLQGKEAVFVTKINYIVNTVSPELTDEFIEENFSELYGWATVSEMKEDIQKNFREAAVKEYIMNYMTYEVIARSIPDELTEYQVKTMQGYYQSYADEYGMNLDEFLMNYVGVSGIDELIEISQEDNFNNTKYSLVVQAVAEDANISVNNEDLLAFFTEYMGTSDYSDYEEQYGMPYLKQVTLQQKVLDFIVENAVLA